MDYDAINARALAPKRRRHDHEADHDRGGGGGGDDDRDLARRAAHRRGFHGDGLDGLDDDGDDDDDPRDVLSRDFARWSEEQLRDFLEMKDVPHRADDSRVVLLNKAVDAELGVAPSGGGGGGGGGGGDEEVDPLDAFMAGVAEETKPAPSTSRRPAAAAAATTTTTANRRPNAANEDEDFDPIESFLAARDAAGARKTKTNAATRSANRGPSLGLGAKLLAKSGFKVADADALAHDSDDDVYAAAAAADADADDRDGAGVDDRRTIEPLGRVDHAAAAYAPFQKNFHPRDNPDVAAWSERDVEARRRALDVQIVGRDPPRMIERFGQCGGVDAVTLRTLKQRGYESPTPIQACALPALLRGRDVLGIAKTGSGKTAAFLIPATHHCLAQPEIAKGDGPIVLTLAPVRELAAQIVSEARRFGKPHGVRVVGVFGGASKQDQFKDLRAGGEIAIGTPGRVVDLCKTKNGLSLTRVTFLVLDEADRMLDLGFEASVRSICDAIRPDRQAAMFSATMPPRVRGLVRDVLTGNGEGEEGGGGGGGGGEGGGSRSPSVGPAAPTRTSRRPWTSSRPARRRASRGFARGSTRSSTRGR